MADPLVSVIVPSYNQGAFIGATLASILEQDYPNIECLVVDGGSTDETLNILRAWQDQRLIWTSEPDAGQSDAINKGMRRARGAILSYLNSDDLLLPGAVRSVVAALDQHPAVDLIYCDCDLIGETGNLLGVSPGEPFHLAEVLVGRHAIRQPGTFWRRKVYTQVGDFDTTLHFSMDTDYWLRVALAGFTLEYVAGRRAAFRLHGKSKSVSMQPKFLSDWKSMMDKVYTSPGLPPEILALRSESDAFARWGWAKTYWTQRDYRLARPLLKQFIRQGKKGRRLIAASMWVDSYLHTPFTRLLAWLFRSLTGQEILFGERRAI